MPGPESKKLSAREQLLLCSLLAVGYNAQRCADIFEEEHGISITRENVSINYLHDKKWKKIIQRMAREAEKKVLSHPLAQKINRLKILSAAINEAFAWRLDKVYYDKDGTELSRVEKRNTGMIAMLIREAREEVEGQRKGEGVQETAKLSLLQVIKILNNGEVASIENRIGDSAGQTAGVDISRPRNYQIL